MKISERLRGLVRSPWLTYQVLLRGRYDFTYDLMPVHVHQMGAAKRRNLAKAGTLLLHRQLHPRNWPLHMQFELTNHCDLHCPVCPTGSGKLSRRPQAMDVELFERVWREVGPNLLTASLWGWGEPLLHPRIADILGIASTQPVATLVSTNGQSLSRETVRQALIDHPPTYLIVCLDGLTDATNQVYRRGASLQPAIEGVSRLAAQKRERHQRYPILHMRYIVMKHNEHELAHAEEFARDHDFDLLTIRTLLITDASPGDHQELLPSETQWRAYDYQGTERVRRRDYVCQQPFWFPTLFSDGTLMPCDQDSDARLPFGVVTPERSFAELWFGSSAAAVRRVIRDSPDTLLTCRHCPFADQPAEAGSVRAYHLRGPVVAEVGVPGTAGWSERPSASCG